MKTAIIEVTNGPQNWGKFLVGELDEEWQHYSAVDLDTERPLLRAIGFNPEQYLVMDLQTCEGGFFRLGGLASADLTKTRVWVCPMFEPFLEWLYAQYREWRPSHAAAMGPNPPGGYVPFLEGLPAHVDLPDAPFAMQGYRRTGR